MVKFSRRHFLQTAGATLTTWGIHQAAQRQQLVLAQPTRRKLALIVGINKYEKSPLRGCVNDAILMRQLLIHRFGFNPKDITLLLDEKATRQGMLDAFEEHLIKQAKPGDVVVYHYSGHGSLIRDPDPIFVDKQLRGLNGTFVPVDSHLPQNYPAEGGTVADITGHTLFLLMSAIQTENLTAVLDSCFSGAATREIRVRSRDGGDKIEISPQEKAYQEQWLSRLDMSKEDFIYRYRQGIGNGVVLAATQRDQYALDEQLNGFVAGAFSYRLTQHLWQEDTTPEKAIAHINKIIPSRYNQNPLWESEFRKNYQREPIFFLDNPNQTANALVLNNENGQARILLVGIEPGKVTVGQEFVRSDRRGGVQIEARHGLIAIGKVSGRLQVGDRLR